MKRNRFTVMGVLGMLMFALVMGGCPCWCSGKDLRPRWCRRAAGYCRHRGGHLQDVELQYDSVP